MEKASMIGLDIAKNVFEVHGRSAAGEVVLRRSLRRGQVEKLFAKLAPAVIWPEACGSGPHWARAPRQHRHPRRPVPSGHMEAHLERQHRRGLHAAAWLQ